MGKSPRGHLELKGSEGEGPQAGTNLEETKEGQNGRNTWIKGKREPGCVFRTKLGIWSLL